MADEKLELITIYVKLFKNIILEFIVTIAKKNSFIIIIKQTSKCFYIYNAK